MSKYNPQKIEKKWQNYWEAKKIYSAKDGSEKSKYYQLETFPYPSAAGLHVGHPKGYIAEDVHARYMRMRGHEVLYTMGWDAFGLPTENYAIKVGKSPKEVAKANVKNFKRQLTMFGFSYDWEREINTSEPEYYKWTQWLFLQLYKTGMAYQKMAKVNWCPQDQTVLANEQVVDGKCERCSAETVQKEMRQWFFRITDYADRLLSDLKSANWRIDWPEETIKRQQDWVGRSEGAELEFRIKNYELGVKVFTTRPDTLFGATYLVLAPEHSLLENNELRITNYGEVKEYIEKAKHKTELQRKKGAGDPPSQNATEGQGKTGVELKGIKAINPANGEEISVWVADYVLGGYGTGAIMAVPAHDERDYDFAKKFKLPIKPVILKQENESRSYIMGVSEEDLKKIGMEIVEKAKGGFFKVKIPFKNLDSYKDFIRQAMKPNFWNEFTTPKGFYFIFKHKDGRLEELELNDKTNDLIDKYGMIFNSKEPNKESENVYSWLAENDFYKEILIHQDNGVLINSDKFSGMDSEKARWEITNFVGGKKQTQYKLRDWSVSRQRYWGVPIPIIYCRKCSEILNSKSETLNKFKIQNSKFKTTIIDEIEYAVVPVLENDLPVKLPDLKDYRPKGMPPLASSEKFLKVKCPKCGNQAQRDPETLDTFVDSSWYYLRYVDSKNSKKPFDELRAKYWLPVDLYVIGAEHVTAHLLYARFIAKFLYDQGYLKFKEPFLKLRHQGMILGPDGRRMSKRWGNVINPDDVIGEYGADAVRLYEMFMGPFEDGQPWDTKGLVGTYRFLNRVWNLVFNYKNYTTESEIKADKEPEMVKAIKKISEDIQSFKFNTCVSELMKLLNMLEFWARGSNVSSIRIPKNYYEIFIKLLSPFAPHITEELWQGVLGNKKSIHLESWPEYNKTLLEQEEVLIVIQVNGRVRDSFNSPKGLIEQGAKEKALSLENVKKYVQEGSIKKIIYIQDKLINFVI